MPDRRLVPVLEEAKALGFLGPGPVDEHIDHARGFVRAWGGPPPGRFVDLGSGGGVPGVVLALAWPDATGVLLDANERRTAFLERVVVQLGLHPRVAVRRERAEVAGRAATLRGGADLVAARAFGPPAVTAECAAALLAVGGRLVVSEPPDDSHRWPENGLATLGMTLTRIVTATARYAVVTQVAPCPDRFPRRVGIPAKRPVF